jgi:GNAT superfamily N-acetyltransferase
MKFEFSGTIWYWRGPAPHHFITVPAELCQDLRAISRSVTYGWGMIPARVRIGQTEWKTSLFPKDGGYKEYRGKGVAAAALQGALKEIARLGGGTVESYPEDADGRSVSGSFLYNGTISMFERQGFRRDHRLGKNHWVVTKVVRGSSNKRAK